MQRELCLRQGFRLIEWTFDPLEIKNSWFNLERLGAVVRRYAVNQYGITASPLQGGLPSDRLVAEWWLESDRVRHTLEDGRPEKIEVVERVAVPVEVYAWKSEPETRHLAAEAQRVIRDAMQQHLAAGLAVTGYERDAAGNGSFLLGRWAGAEF
jgi:predicted GNAT superfamily acetyltransferase